MTTHIKEWANEFVALDCTLAQVRIELAACDVSEEKTRRICSEFLRQQSRRTLSPKWASLSQQLKQAYAEGDELKVSGIKAAMTYVERYDFPRGRVA